MFLKFFKRKNVLLFIICLSMLWILTFLYVVNKNEDIKSFNGGFLASSNKNFSNDDFKQLEKLEILVQKMKMESDENRFHIKDLKKHVDLLVKPQEIIKTLHKVPQQLVPVLVLAFNRPSVSRCLDLLLKYRTSVEQFPIVVSQDGDHVETSSTIERYKDKLLHLHHTQPDISVSPKQKKFLGYYKLSSHYKWALNKVFELFPQSTSVIIVEDDLDISPDFFSYFNATLPLLTQDPTLICVSAWNDNGKSELVDTSALKLLYRTDFFPGLGWMLKKEFWLELESKWPDAFWDDWLRDPLQRKDRSCIRPEISRTRTFGKKGVSNGQFYEKHLKYIVLNSEPVQWEDVQLDYLLKDKYDESFLTTVYSLPLVDEASNFQGHGSSVRIEYENSLQFKDAAKKLGIMDDFKAGVPRTGYLGIVSLMKNNVRVFVAPNRSKWSGYITSWS